MLGCLSTCVWRGGGDLTHFAGCLFPHFPTHRAPNVWEQVTKPLLEELESREHSSLKIHLIQMKDHTLQKNMIIENSFIFNISAEHFLLVKASEPNDYILFYSSHQ